MIQGLITILKNNDTIENLIGTNKATSKTKVFPGICPQPEESPYIVVRRTGKPPFAPCKGVVTTVFKPLFEVIIYHKSYDKIEAIEAAVVSALDWYTGTSEGFTYKTIQFQTSFDADYIVDYSLHARVIEFEAIASESQAT
jgi:hypothetical protein